MAALSRRDLPDGNALPPGIFYGVARPAGRAAVQGDEKGGVVHHEAVALLEDAPVIGGGDHLDPPGLVQGPVAEGVPGLGIALPKAGVGQGATKMNGPLAAQLQHKASAAHRSTPGAVPLRKVT